MNNSDRNHTLEQLQQRGLLDANKMAAAVNSDGTDHNNTNDTPWFIHLFFGFSGVLASLFFIGFLTLILFETDIFDSAIGMFIIGILLSVAGSALFKNKHTRRSNFWNSLAFAISAAGQLYVVFALFSSDIEQPLSIWLFVLIQIFMTLIMPNFVYRLLSSMAALGGMVYLLSFYQVPELSLGLLALVTIVANLQRYELLQSVPVKWKAGKCRSGAFDISKAVSYASAIMLLIFSVYIIAADYSNNFTNSDEIFSYNYLVAQGLLILASLYAAYLILKHYRIELLSQSSIVIVGAIAVLGITSIYVSGLLATSLIVVIAIANSQRILLGIGILGLVSYIFWYYYQLDTSLLVKSGSMLIIGIVMLLMRWLLVSRYFAHDLSSSATLINNRASQTDSEERLS